MPFPMIDLLQYWAAAQLFVAGANPYDVQALLTIQQTVDPTLQAPIIMWNPPLIFAFIWPLGFLDFDTARVAWMIISVCAIASSGVFLRRVLEARLQRYLYMTELLFVLCIFLLFYPHALALWYGQMAPLLGLAVAGALWLAYRKNAWCLAGMVFSITCIKPHLLFLFYLLVAWRGLAYAGVWRRFLIGLLIGCSIFALPGLFTGWQQYFSHAYTPPYYWQTPTLGSWLQLILTPSQNDTRTFVRFFPSLIAVGVLAIFEYRNRVFSEESDGGFWQTYMRIAPLSLLCAPYGWVYDYVLILPVALWLAVPARRLSVLLLFCATLFALIPGNIGQQYLIGYPFLIWLAVEARLRHY
jgi:hypothetical protein